MRLPPIVRRLGLLVLSPIAFFLLLEAIGYSLGIEIRGQNKAYLEGHETRVCRFSSETYEKVCRPERIRDKMRPQSIFTLGGSTVLGYPPGEMPPFSAHLYTNLFIRAPGVYSVHNFGRSCKNSYFVLHCLERVIELAPSLIVIYSGHNDFGSFISESPGPAYLLQAQPWLIALEYAAAQTRAYSLVLELFRLSGGEPNKPYYRIPDAAYDKSRAAAFAHYRRNIDAILRLAETKGIPIVLMTLVSNLHEHPSPRPHWKMADGFWEKVSGPHGGRWHKHHSKAMQLFNAGDKQAALSEFLKARDELMDSRAPSEVNELLRERAAASPNVHLVDIEARLFEEGVDEGIGCNYFGTDEWCDQFHPNEGLHKMMALELEKKVLELLPLPPRYSK